MPSTAASGCRSAAVTVRVVLAGTVMGESGAHNCPTGPVVRAVATNAALTDARVTRGLVVADPPPQPRHMRSTRAKTLARAEQEGRRVILDAMRAFRTYRLTVRGHGQLVDGVRRAPANDRAALQLAGARLARA